MSIDEENAADHALMSDLRRLHENHHKKSDSNARGKLANLRYALRNRLHEDYPVGRVFPALAPLNKNDYAERLTDNPDRNEWRTVIAGLFGFAHDDVEDERKTSLGSALRTLYNKRENDSLERRFMALLNADAEHLPGHLRQSISLLKAESIGLDWEMLLADVCAWNVSGKPIQKKWIAAYYRSLKADAAEPPADTASADAAETHLFSDEPNA